MSADRSDINGAAGEASLSRWSLAASIRASGTQPRGYGGPAGGAVSSPLAASAAISGHTAAA